MRKLSLNRGQGGADVGGVDVRREKLVLKCRGPLKTALRDRFDVGRGVWGGQISAGVGIDRHFPAVFSVAVRAHGRIDDVSGREMAAGAWSAAVVEGRPALALGLIKRHRALRDVVVQIRRARAGQLVADAARVFALRGFRPAGAHARCQSSAPLIQFP